MYHINEIESRFSLITIKVAGKSIIHQETGFFRNFFAIKKKRGFNEV